MVAIRETRLYLSKIGEKNCLYTTNADLPDIPLDKEKFEEQKIEKGASCDISSLLTALLQNTSADSYMQC